MLQRAFAGSKARQAGTNFRTPPRGPRPLYLLLVDFYVGTAALPRPKAGVDCAVTNYRSVKLYYKRKLKEK